MKRSWMFWITPVLLLSALLRPLGGGESPDPSLLSVQRIFGSEEFKAKELGAARWLKHTSGYTTLEKSDTAKGGKDIVRHDPETGSREVLVPAARLVPAGQDKPLKIRGHSWSKDGKKLLVFTNTKRVWRRNTRGDYWVLDLSSRDLRKIGGDAEPSTLMFAKFSPAGDRVGYVCKKNLYVQDLASFEITQLTRDGSETIINGTSDWVNEEEFSLRDGFRWGPDGGFIAYWQFNTEGVKEFHLINYTDSLYPRITSFAYPKAGQTNSACRVGVVRAGGGETRWFDVPGDPRNHYIPRMDWAPETQDVFLQHMNRLQNTNEIMTAAVHAEEGGGIRTGPVETILTERDEAWVDINDELKWAGRERGFIWLSERDGWQHVYLVSPSKGRVTLLTPGDFDVLSVASIDEKGGWVYYIASPDNPTQRYLHRAPLDGSGRSERLTPGDQPGTHSYRISPDARWAIHTHSSFGEPPVVDLIRLPEHERVRVLEDNSELREKLGRLRKGRMGFFRVDIGDGVLLDGWRILPPDLDPKKGYPLFFHVYGEPAGQTVLDRWGGNNYLWHLMLAQRGYVVASVDNRGTPAPRGRAWRKCIYRQIGILASSDQAAAARAILSRWPFTDPDRVGIWGWSGGGSMSLNAIFRYPDLYHCALAIAFISNERFYDTIYQERYMGLPDDNEEGYKNGSPITFARRLGGKLLIVHGTADDNCHYQSFEALVNELIKHDKQFSMMSYPNRTHSIQEGPNTRRHLYTLLTRYLTENLPPGPRPRKPRTRVL